MATLHTTLSLFGGEIIFEEFQRMWSRYLNVTNGQTDDIQSHNPRSALASRGRKHEMMSWLPSWKYDVISKIWTPSIDVYLKNNPAKFHPDPIWNDGDLGLFEDVAPTKNKN